MDRIFICFYSRERVNLFLSFDLIIDDDWKAHLIFEYNKRLRLAFFLVSTNYQNIKYFYLIEWILIKAK